MVEIRKLLLFIYDEIPDNSSWRFIDQSHVFADPTYPFGSTFSELININDLQATLPDEYFKS